MADDKFIYEVTVIVETDEPRNSEQIMAHMLHRAIEAGALPTGVQVYVSEAKLTSQPVQTCTVCGTRDAITTCARCNDPLCGECVLDGLGEDLCQYCADSDDFLCEDCLELPATTNCIVCDKELCVDCALSDGGWDYCPNCFDALARSHLYLTKD